MDVLIQVPLFVLGKLGNFLSGHFKKQQHFTKASILLIFPETIPFSVIVLKIYPFTLHDIGLAPCKTIALAFQSI